MRATLFPDGAEVLPSAAGTLRAPHANMTASVKSSAAPFAPNKNTGIGFSLNNGACAGVRRRYRAILTIWLQRCDRLAASDPLDPARYARLLSLRAGHQLYQLLDFKRLDQMRIEARIDGALAVFLGAVAAERNNIDPVAECLPYPARYFV